jgi:hypothetical protein
MKTYQLIAGVCALFAALLPVSCTFEEGDGREPAFESGMAVRLSITHGQPATRTVAEGIDVQAPVAHGHTLNVGSGSGHLFFITGDGIITKYVRVLPSGSNNDDGGNTTIGFDKIKGAGGSVIENVPYASEHACIIMNLPGDGEITGATVGYPISGVMPVVTTEQLYDDDTNGGVDKMPVIGAGALIATPGEAYNKVVEMGVKGIGARIEIREIRTEVVALREITAFKLTGIFINNYYPYIPYFDEYPALMNAGSDTLNYSAQFFNANNGSTLYTADYGGLGVTGISSYSETLSVNAGQDAEGEDLVWGYNFFPNEMTEDKECLPHIVLRFQAVSVYDDHGGGPNYTVTDVTRFVTVKGYKIQVNGDLLSLPTLLRGFVYQIDDFVISYEELQPLPETNAIDVSVTANVIGWNTVVIPHDL